MKKKKKIYLQSILRKEKKKNIILCFKWLKGVYAGFSAGTITVLLQKSTWSIWKSYGLLQVLCGQNV